MNVFRINDSEKLVSITHKCINFGLYWKFIQFYFHINILIYIYKKKNYKKKKFNKTVKIATFKFHLASDFDQSQPFDN